MDTHTAVAKSVYEKYRAQTGDTATKTVIASTASPFKFTGSVMQAIDPSCEETDDFALADRLSELAKVPVPRAVEETRAQYGAWCAAIARRLLTDSREVEGGLNDCALAVWNAIPPAEPKHFRGWLGAIVRHRALGLV